MKFSNDIITKVIAQYLGQRLSAELIYKGFTCELVINNFTTSMQNGMTIGTAIQNNAKLILKPLSAITDEDAIEVGKLVGIWSDKEIEQMQPLEEGTIKLLIQYGKNYSQVVGSKNDLGIAFLDFGGSSRKLFLAHQFLQNKGYDLPQFLLDGKTLFEAGLAIYEN